VPRLDLLLSRNLGLSRKMVRRHLRAGDVLDPAGNRLADPALQIHPDRCPYSICWTGTEHQLHARADLLQHKPTGVVTALRDGRHPTAYALLRGQPLFRELRAVGRLDLDTSGLLFWTTDGSLLHRLTHPRYEVEREYQAAIAGPFRAPPPDLTLDDGHRPSITALEPLAEAMCHPALLRPDASHLLARIVVRSGRFHEVKRIFSALGTEVLALARVRYGPVTLPPALGPGAALPLDLRGCFPDLHPRPGP
jgi:16S rRNA pseudouridine516 synthase